MEVKTFLDDIFGKEKKCLLCEGLGVILTSFGNMVCPHCKGKKTATMKDGDNYVLHVEFPKDINGNTRYEMWGAEVINLDIINDQRNPFYVWKEIIEDDTTYPTYKDKWDAIKNYTDVNGNKPFYDRLQALEDKGFVQFDENGNPV